MPDESALSDVTLYTIGKTESWRLGSVADLQVSWEWNRPGTMTFRVPFDQVAGLGPGSSAGILDAGAFTDVPDSTPDPFESRGDLLGKWVEYEHPTAGFWGGRITNVQHQDGVVTVGAEGYLSLLKGRRHYVETPVDQTLEQYLTAAIKNRKDALYLSAVNLSGMGDLNISGSGGDLLDDVLSQAIDLMPAMTAAKMEMRTRTLTLFSSWVPTSATLAAGSAVRSWTLTEDLWAGANTVRVQIRYAVGKKKYVAPFPGKADASIRRLGVIEADLVQLRGLALTETRARAQADRQATRLAADFWTVTLEVVDEDGAFQALQPANDGVMMGVGVDLGPITGNPASGLQRKTLYVVAKSLDVASGVMTVSLVPYQL